MSYLINKNTGKLVAVSPIYLPFNTACTCSSSFVAETMYGCRELSPSINAIECYISNSRKWDKQAETDEMIDEAELINKPDDKSNRYEFKI